jgi:membrane-bound lytic murein transglycosylase D
VHPQRYTVRRGDTLITVADRFGVSVEELRRWNHLSSNTIAPGRAITVAEPVKLAPGMRVRGKGSRSKNTKRVASTSTRAKTTNTSAKQPTKKSSGGAHAKSTSTKSKSSSSKSKSKAAR